MKPSVRGLDILQQISMSLMAVLVMITFVAANLHAILWQSSDWLVSTVLPAVVVDLTNQEREDNSAAPLRRSSVLDEAARMKAEDMSKHEYFAHYSPDGVSPWHWFDEAGYTYAHAGENLAIHFTDSSEVVDAWMNSPSHRKNIVDSKFTEIGVGTAKGTYEGYDTVYVVQLFGTPAVASKPKSVPPTPKPRPVPEPVQTVSSPVLAAVPEPAEKPAVVAEEIPTSVPAPEPVEVVIAEDTNSIEVLDSVIEPELPEESTSIPVSPQPTEVVVLESPIISTSSGLAVAQITTPQPDHAGATLASIATQPNRLLQVVYVTLGVVVLFLLSTSIVLEARRFHYRQVAYGVLLIFVMGGLWLTHTLLTAGAVIT